MLVDITSVFVLVSSKQLVQSPFQAVINRKPTYVNGNFVLEVFYGFSLNKPLKNNIELS